MNESLYADKGHDGLCRATMMSPLGWGRWLAPLLCAAMGACLIAPPRVMGQAAEATDPPGQPLLNKALQVKLTASNMGDLEEVVQLCEKAIAEGLSEGDQQFAKSLLTSSLYEHAYRIAQSIFERDPPPQQWQLLMRLALRDLERVLGYDKQHAESHLLMARLHLLPGGDRQQGKEAAEQAVRLLAEDAERRSAALVARARFSDDAQQSLADYNEAIQLDPRNADAWRGRGTHYLAQGEMDKAIEDFLKLLQLDESDVGALQSVAAALTSQKRLDEALTYATKAVELNPDAVVPYKLRAQIHLLRDEPKKALDDLTRALKSDPGDISALVMRAQLWQEQNELENAKADIARALDLRPGFARAILVRSLLAATEHRYSDAIADLNQLLRDDPKNTELRLQIAAFYYQDKRPTKAVDTCTAILRDEPDLWQALRLRGDAFLLLGKHAEAVTDYEASLKIKADDSSVLNNLAWVLATSPDEKVRNGERSIELATRACEVTEYKAAHILSTLAAGYAEQGDYDKAIHWSSKAVQQAREDLTAPDEQRQELDKHFREQLEQLENELSSYKQNKPWRELIQTEEKADPPAPKLDDLGAATKSNGTPPVQDGKLPAPDGQKQNGSGGQTDKSPNGNQNGGAKPTNET